MTSKQTKPSKERVLKTAKYGIYAFSCLMQQQMTDDSKGEIYDAVPVGKVEEFFKILDKQLTQLLTQTRQEAVEDERNRIIRWIKKTLLTGSNYDDAVANDVIKALSSKDEE